VVPMRLRAHEDVVPHVQANASPYVRCKVIAAGVIGAPKKIAGEDRAVEANAFRANASLELGLSTLADRRGPHGIHAVKDRPIGVEEQVDVLMRPARNASTSCQLH